MKAFHFHVDGWVPKHEPEGETLQQNGFTLEKVTALLSPLANGCIYPSEDYEEGNMQMKKVCVDVSVNVSITRIF